MSCYTIRPFHYGKQALFTIFISNHVNNSIYKSDTITPITEFLKNYNSPNILNLYSPSSNHPQSSVIASIHNATITYEDQMHQPLAIEFPYKNMALPLRTVGMSDTAIDPVISSIINKKPVIIYD